MKVQILPEKTEKKFQKTLPSTSLCTSRWHRRPSSVLPLMHYKYIQIHIVLYLFSWIYFSYRDFLSVLLNRKITEYKTNNFKINNVHSCEIEPTAMWNICEKSIIDMKQSTVCQLLHYSTSWTNTCYLTGLNAANYIHGQNQCLSF